MQEENSGRNGEEEETAREALKDRERSGKGEKKVKKKDKHKGREG